MKFSKVKRAKLFLTSLVFLLTIGIIIAIFYNINIKEDYSSDTVVEAFLDEEKSYSLTVEALVNSYENNEEIADDNYLNTNLKINGVIEGIEYLDDSTELHIKTEDSKYDVLFNFNNQEDLDDYSIGDIIYIYGYLTRNGNNLEFVDCYLDIDVFEVDQHIKDLILFAKEQDEDLDIDISNAMSFDSDILAYLYGYSDIVENLAKISNGKIGIYSLSEKSVGDKIEMTLDINSKNLKIKLDNNKFKFDKAFIQEINRELERQNSEKLFYYSISDYSEDFDIISILYITQRDAELLNEVVNLSKASTNELSYLDVEIFEK